MKLLAIDMDGTCLNSKRKLTDETLDALIKAKKEGVEIVPITGRPFNFLPKSILENDLTMFDHAGLKLAMGNAVEKLKELADHILPSNDDFGVKVAIERFILNNFTLKD